MIPKPMEGFPTAYDVRSVRKQIHRREFDLLLRPNGDVLIDLKVHTTRQIAAAAGRKLDHPHSLRG
jgi:hypothetical protein